MFTDIYKKDKQYKIIYADPPWRYKVWSGKGKKSTAENHYPTMDIRQIYDLPVEQLADEDSVLFLWATAPCLQEAINTIRNWGFTFKTVAFTWIKRNKKSGSLFWGLGHWTRANPEYCLLGTRGQPQRINKAVHSVIESIIRRHSRKPDEAAERIVKMMGDLPRIELFARNAKTGWDYWGNEMASGETNLEV